jgi:hypothetical protein
MTVFALYSPTLWTCCQSVLHWEMCSRRRKAMKNQG